MVRLAMGCIVGLSTVCGLGSEAEGASTGARVLFFVFLMTFFLSCVHGSAGRRPIHLRPPGH